MKNSKTLLVAISMVLNSCLSVPLPRVDLCVILTNGDGWCIPQNQPGKKEYGIPKEQLVGGFWITAEHLGEIKRYQKQIEELLRSCEDSSLLEDHTSEETLPFQVPPK